MYKQATVDGEAMACMATAKRPMGPEFTAQQVEQADLMEVWCSSILDKGEDFTRFDLKARGGKLIASVIVPGY
jgi:hypothetical protein